MTDEGRPEVESALLRRIEDAVRRAEELRAESEVLVDASAALRDERMAVRCAWCGRFRVGARWVVVERTPAFTLAASASHSICEDCLEALRASGRSV